LPLLSILKVVAGLTLLIPFKMVFGAGTNKYENILKWCCQVKVLMRLLLDIFGIRVCKVNQIFKLGGILSACSTNCVSMKGTRASKPHAMVIFLVSAYAK
jgi:hypothetical protein